MKKVMSMGKLNKFFKVHTFLQALTFHTLVRPLGGVLCGQVLAGTAYGLATHERHVVVSDTTTAFGTTWKHDWTLVWDHIKVSLVLLVPTRSCPRNPN